MPCKISQIFPELHFREVDACMFLCVYWEEKPNNLNASCFGSFDNKQFDCFIEKHYAEFNFHHYTLYDEKKKKKEEGRGKSVKLVWISSVEFLKGIFKFLFYKGFFLKIHFYPLKSKYGNLNNITQSVSSCESCIARQVLKIFLLLESDNLRDTEHWWNSGWIWVPDCSVYRNLRSLQPAAGADQKSSEPQKRFLFISGSF